MFQRAEGCAVLLPNAVGRGKEIVPTILLPLWPCLLHLLSSQTLLLPPLTLPLPAPRAKPSPPPLPKRRRTTTRYTHNLLVKLVAASCMVQRAVDCAVLLFNTAIGPGRRALSVTLPSPHYFYPRTTLALPPSSNSDPGSHSGPSSPLPTMHGYVPSFFIARRTRHFLPSATRVELIVRTHAAR